MTLKQFSKEYNIPYNIVYMASYMVKPVSTWVRDRDYPEDELYHQMIHELNKRVEKHASMAEKYKRFCLEMKKCRHEKNLE